MVVCNGMCASAVLRCAGAELTFVRVDNERQKINDFGGGNIFPGFGRRIEPRVFVQQVNETNAELLFFPLSSAWLIVHNKPFEFDSTNILRPTPPPALSSKIKTLESEMAVSESVVASPQAKVLGSKKNDFGPVLFLLFGDMREGENMEWWFVTAFVQ